MHQEHVTAVICHQRVNAKRESVPGSRFFRDAAALARAVA
jgi:hypothetical protein